jgi:Protein of unknown function (DUF664)
MAQCGGVSTDSGSGHSQGQAAGARDGEITRSFGWKDMFVRPEDDPRSNGGLDGERATLTNYLRDYRLTLELKCTGLDADGMAARSVPPSNLSLLGLVRHIAEVERNWFRRVLAGQDVAWLYRREDDKTPPSTTRSLTRGWSVPRGRRGGRRCGSPSGSPTTRRT